jgi:tetratricopeptide (TPR) repeat protein
LLGRFEEALADYSAAEHENPNDLWLYRARGELYLSRELYELALHDLDKTLQLKPEQSTVYKRRAVAHFHLNHFPEALADLETALELRPDDNSTLVWISPTLVKKCPDESFREGLIDLAGNTPDSKYALQHKVRLYLGLGEWRKAQADLKKIFASQDASYFSHYQHALSSLILNETPAYRDRCAAMVAEFRQTDDAMSANFVAWTCALAPDAVEDYELAIALAVQAVDAQPPTDQFFNTLGAILFRAGRQEEAIERLEELERRREAADEGTARSSPAYTWYFLTMAHYAAGNAEQAQEYLNKANQWTDEVLADEASPPAWNRRATLEILRKEAETLLESDAPEPTQDNQAK